MPRIDASPRAAWLLLCACAGSACGLIHQTLRVPVQVASGVIPGASPRPDPAMVQGEVLRFADSFTGHTTVGVDAYMQTLHTPRARLQALQWKLALDSAAIAIAAGPNPYVSVLDLITLPT